MKVTKQGTIIRKLDQRTAVVEVSRMKSHALYNKRFKVVKNFLSDDEKNEYNVGDVVIIEECRPLSKKKHFKVTGRVGSANMLGDEKIENEEILGAERPKSESEEDIEEEKNEAKEDGQ